MSVPERVHFLRICFCPSPRLKKSQEQDWYRCTKWHMFWCNFPERSYVYPPGYAGLEPRRIKSESNGKPGGDLSSSVWHVTICNGSVLSARYVTAVNTAVGHSLVVGGGGVTDCYNTRTIAVGAVAATTTETLPGVAAAAVGLSIWHWKMTLESLCYEPIPPSEQLPHHATS